LLAGLAGVAGSSAAGATATSTRWCLATPSAAWRSLTARHLVPLPKSVAVYPFAFGHDHSFFASVHSRHGFSGIVRIDGDSGYMTEIKAFPHVPLVQAGGGFDGRWLVWTVWPGQGEASVPWTIWAWDSRTGRIWKVGAARRHRDGAWDRTWIDPDVRGGFAAWGQARSIHLYDLRTRHDLVIRPSHPGWPRLFAGHLAAWSGSNSMTYAVSALTGKPVSVPRALRGVNSLLGLGTDGHAIAYPKLKSLWWSPSLRQPLRKVLTARGSHWFDYPLHVGGGYIGLGMEPGLFVGSTRAHRYVRISRWGSVLAGRRALVVDEPASQSKSVYAPTRVAFIPLGDVPAMPPCAT
jgi:hypothetical protein